LQPIFLTEVIWKQIDQGVDAVISFNMLLHKHIFRTVMLTVLELVDRDRHAIERRIRQAKSPVVKSLNSFNFLMRKEKMLLLDSSDPATFCTYLPHY
jgi:DNA replication protein DnaC